MLPAAPAPKATLTLEDCLSLAVRQNPRALAALASIEEAIGLSTAARSGFIPKISATAYYQRRENDFGDDVDLTTIQQRITFLEQLTFALQNPGTALPAPIARGSEIRKEDYNVTVRLTHNLYSGGRVRALVAISYLQQQERFFTYQAVLNALLLETRLAFYQVIRTQERVRIQRDAVARQQAEVDLQAAQFDAGMVGELNVMRAEVSRAAVHPALLTAEAEHQTALLDLAEVLAIEPDPETGEVPIKVEGALEIIAPSIDLPNALGKATAVRPELSAKRKLIDQLERRITVARSGVLPQVNAFGTYQFFSELNKNQPNANVTTFTLGVNGTWRIFDGLQAKGEIAAARGLIEAEKHRLRQLTLTIENEVRTAFVQYEGALATYRVASESSGLAREALKNTRASYEAGLSGQLEVLQAERDITTTEEVVLNARFQLNAAIAELDAAIGSDIDFTEMPEARPLEEVPSP